VKQYLKTAPAKTLDEIRDYIDKLREEQFKKENFGMSYAEFDAWIEASRNSGTMSLEDFDKHMKQKFGAKYAL